METIVNFTPTGLIPTKEMTPHVPITAAEIIDDVVGCHAIGITTAHIHAREKSGKPAFKKENYARIISGIRERIPDLVICVSTSGRTFPEFDRRSDVLNLRDDTKPDMASLLLGSVDFRQGTSVNSPQTVMRLAEKMNEKGIRPELEVFDVGMMRFARYLIEKGFLTPPYYFNIILGNMTSAGLNPYHLAAILHDLPDNSYWSFGGIGAAQLPAHMIAIALNGGVRVGIEDNIWFDRKKTHAATNEDLVTRVTKMIHLNEKTVMSPRRFREVLDI
jgi:3-keto-5-aminohexanoate cleavage enzyme